MSLYQSSLFILVYPWAPDINAEDDGVRLFMTPEEAQLFNLKLVEALKEMDIPFMELKEPNRRKRVTIIEEIVTKGKVPLSNYSLR